MSSKAYTSWKRYPCFALSSTKRDSCTAISENTDLWNALCVVKIQQPCRERRIVNEQVALTSCFLRVSWTDKLLYRSAELSVLLIDMSLMSLMECHESKSLRRLIKGIYSVTDLQCQDLHLLKRDLGDGIKNNGWGHTGKQDMHTEMSLMRPFGSPNHTWERNIKMELIDYVLNQ